MIVWYATSRAMRSVSRKYTGSKSGSYIPPQRLEPGPIEQGTAVAVVDVFLHGHSGDLLLKLEHLALYRPFLLLGIGAHACVQHRSFHTIPLIP
jgi:hypothetical protein